MHHMATLSAKLAADGAPDKPLDDPFLLIPGQSADYPVEIPSSWEPSPADSSASSWINLVSDSSRPSGSGREKVSQETLFQEKLKSLKQVVATLQAQLQALQPSTPKITAFNANVELVKDTLSTNILVATASPLALGNRMCV